MSQQWVEEVGEYILTCPKGCGTVLGYSVDANALEAECMWCDSPMEGFILRKARV